MSSEWHKLRFPQTERLPPLLYQYTPTTKGYQVYLTDLTNVWSEQLGFKEILRRAEDESTTIDPNDDPDQFDVLLGKIGEALQRGPGSNITLSAGSRVNSLELLISIKLPAPLQPLRWTIYLSKESPAVSTSLLLIPLLKEEADWTGRQQALIDQLKQKDWVLGKLFDKIESLGLDLSTLFPGTAGLRTAHKGSTLSHAAKYIKGVAPFDEKAWLAEGKTAEPGHALAHNLLVELSDGHTGIAAEKIEPAESEWWEVLQTRQVSAAPTGDEGTDRAVPTSGKHAEPEAETESEPEPDADGFERQETPPRLKKHRDEETASITSADEAAEMEVATPSSAQQRVPTPKKPSKGLGVIGGKAANKQTVVASPSSTTSQPSDSRRVKTLPERKEKKDLATETESESDLDKTKTAQTPPPKASAARAKSRSPPRKSRGLGVIGGKKKTARSPSPLSESQPPAASGTVTAPSGERAAPPVSSAGGKVMKKTHKLGVIGGKHAPRQAKAEEGEEEASQAAVPDTPAPSSASTVSTKEHPKAAAAAVAAARREPERGTEETEEEKAERRREELKRRLEAQSKDGAATKKKKRKF